MSQAQRWIIERIKPGDIVVDATAGNGADTLFLAQLAGAEGKVYAFDIQSSAIENTRQRLNSVSETEGLAPVDLLHTSHENMASGIPVEHHGQISVIMFNLGYLPGASHDIITKSSTTLSALKTAVLLLRSGGLLTIVVYPGHEGGDQEANAVYAWASDISPSLAQTIVYRFPQKPTAPYLIALIKS
ncbi:class I SAM-dependent methyltransferase [Cohnella sp.]|uniref:tRNA (mnm(5)s(2)U34)-methyltransferase n=1 Tax=Cohnella sp. TaxID=1883426 RepID=UPI003564886B